MTIPNFHPFLAGLPVAFLLLLIVFELVNFFRPNYINHNVVKLVLLITGVSVCAAFFSGYQALEFINRDCAVPEDVIARHNSLGKIILFLTIALLVFGSILQQARYAQNLCVLCYRSLLIACLVFVLFTGMLGGQLVFEHGLAVVPACPKSSLPN